MGDFVYLLVGIPALFIPIIVANSRGTTNQGLILVLSFLSLPLLALEGLGLLVWVVALLMACISKTAKQQAVEKALVDRHLSPLPPSMPALPEKPDFEAEIRKLARLKEDGLISSEEYEQKKRVLLGI